ncbi:MAG: hypothetical protein LBD03_07460 [Methanobrevibacter sp.]|jgi:hypothetical protein|nr:hypothetical protein [Candidatus Methanovirga procula]
MKKFGLLILAMLLTSFVSVGAVSAQQVIIKSPSPIIYVANYECRFYDSEGKHLTSDDFSGTFLAGQSDVKKTIPSDAATLIFHGKAVGGGSQTLSIEITGTGDILIYYDDITHSWRWKYRPVWLKNVVG